MSQKPTVHKDGHGTPRLLKRYRQEIVPQIMKERGHGNALQVARLEKVVVNMGVKEGALDIKILDQVAHELGQVTGQKPLITRARKAISGFKLKQGVPIGLKVTLRKNRMYEFIDRLFNIAMPRIRDFRGFPDSSFDQHGNYTLGIQEQIIFPEISTEKIEKPRGMNITFVTSTNDDSKARELLVAMGFPLRA